MTKLIAQGAEAKLFREDDKLVKERIPKGYRVKKLDDKIRKSRTKAEVKMIGKARRAGVNAPTIFHNDDFKIEMEFLEGKKVKDSLNKKHLYEICSQIGEQVGKLHKWDIVHGDLTTSNMILKDNEVYFIDFGLAYHSDRDEDKAMDISVLEEAFLSAHTNLFEDAMEIILEHYKKANDDADKVLNRLEKVKERGRYIKKD